jgi:hypothetical protein
MNRREFQTAILASFGASSLGWIGSEQALATALAPAVSNYQYRLRFLRAGRVFYIWVRVVDLQQMSIDVPVKLLISTDVARLNVVRSATHTARALDSHIIRTDFKVGEMTGWSPGAPLYATLRLGQQEILSKAWTLLNTASVTT